MSVTVNPLQQNVPIIDLKTGNPTPYFLRQMQTLAETATAASNVLTILDSTVLLAAAASVEFAVDTTNINDLIIAIHGRGDTAATTATVRLRFNGDTGNNYYSDRVNRSGSVQVVAGAYAEAGVVSAASTTAGQAGAIELIIPGAGGALFKQFSYTSFCNDNITPLAQYGGGTWGNDDAITSITLYLSAGNFDVGTTVSLYGRGS